MLAPLPLRPCLFRFAKRALVTNGIRSALHERRASVCGLAAALRFGSVPAVSPPPLHCFRAPTADQSLVKCIALQEDIILVTSSQACLDKSEIKIADRKV